MSTCWVEIGNNVIKNRKMVTTNVNIVTDCGRFELNQGFWNKNNTCIWLQVLKISKYSQEVRAKDYDIFVKNTPTLGSLDKG